MAISRSGNWDREGAKKYQGTVFTREASRRWCNGNSMSGKEKAFSVAAAGNECMAAGEIRIKSDPKEGVKWR